MLTRSNSAISAAELLQESENKKLIKLLARPKLRQVLLNISEAEQAQVIAELFQAKYGYPARPEQIEAVVNLINGRTTFLLAGTGFGKSRVPELLYLLYDEEYAPILMSINPLDALGDDQVSEKRLVEMNAVNLTAANCTQETCDSILQGKYTFVYVSPEIALTSDTFDRMWRDASFQARLVLKVVDEAHMVYTWGLVASGQAKRLASHVRVQDGGVFRPSYGDLARRFLSADKVPLLLMSATCPPQAIQAIIGNLKLDTCDVGFVRAELTRPEIRLIRRTFKRPLKASLRGLFPHHTVMPSSSIPPTLLYSGTQNATLEHLQIINSHSSRGHPNEAANGSSDFARRYHATTGPNAKLDAVTAYVGGALAVICCTLALGLGQNWKRVRRVVIVGRQDPCNLIQMSGRCGRDGRRGLGILLVEHKRTNGKNQVSDFRTPTLQTDDDRMDALGITEVCLRIALAVDLRLGYIPLDLHDIAVTEEARRQRAAGMTDCDCSNCRTAEAEALWLAQAALTTENFDSALAMSEDDLVDLVQSMPEPPPPPPSALRHVVLACGPEDPIMTTPMLESLVTRFGQAFTELFKGLYPGDSDLAPNDFFGRDSAWELAKNIDLFKQPNDLAIVLAGDTIPRQSNTLFEVLNQWLADFDTTTLMAEATERRQAANKSNPELHPPQSVEGACYAKARADSEKKAVKEARELEKLAKAEERARRVQEKIEADQLAKDLKARADSQKKAIREARELEKQEAAQAKLEERAQRAKEKLEAEKIAKELKARAESAKRAIREAQELEKKKVAQAKAEERVRIKHLKDLEKQQAALDKVNKRVLSGSSTGIKRGSEGQDLAGPSKRKRAPSKRKQSQQLTTHPKLPIENATIDPSLSQF